MPSEIQLNALPEGDIEKRIQLIRLDNWKDKQTHKNLGHKLNTKSHIHLYNHFDIIRGKVNGGYDIAYNIEESGVDFNKGLEEFLKIVCDDKDFAINELYNKIMTIKNQAIKKVSETSEKE